MGPLKQFENKNNQSDCVKSRDGPLYKQYMARFFSAGKFMISHCFSFVQYIFFLKM